MAIDRIKQVEIFCAFVIDFKKLKTSVVEMIDSSDEQDIKRVEKICAYIEEMVKDASTSEELINKLNGYDVGDRLNKLLEYIKSALSRSEENVFDKIKEHYKTLDEIIELYHLKRGVDAVFNEDVITSDSTVPITTEDLSFLNWIAKLSMENKKEMEEAEKSLKGIEFRDKIRQLYVGNAFYFEQVFSNADVKIQKRILTMIDDYHSRKAPTDEQKEALANLDDISILSDINTLAIKSKSNVSDHQAFDAFCKILKKNNNKKLLNKVLRENIIMTSMFNTNSSTIGEFYALRKMFTSARYPYNKIIIQRYMQLLEKNEAEMALIFKILKKDFEFNRSYEKYVKSEETSDFKKLVLTVIDQIKEDDVSAGTIETLTFIIESFIYMDKHDTDILTQKDIYQLMEPIYYYAFRNNLYQLESPLTKILREFRYARVQSDIKDKISLYHVEDKTVIFGVAPIDLWYDLNRFIFDKKIKHVTKIYFKYDEITYFVFEPGQPFISFGKNQAKPEFDRLPLGEIVIICADVDKANFELYIFGLYNRMARAIYADKITVQLSSVTSSLFKKKIIPGLEKDMEIKLRKILVGIVTNFMLYYLDKRHFVNVYVKKIKILLDEMYQISITTDEIKAFVKVVGADLNRINLEQKSPIHLLIAQLNRFTVETGVDEIFDHGTKFLILFDLWSKEEITH